MPSNKILLATAAAHVLVAAGHTVCETLSITCPENNPNANVQTHQIKGGEFKDAAFRRLRPVLQGQAKAGWYQGSLYFAMMGESSSFAP